MSTMGTSGNSNTAWVVVLVSTATAVPKAPQVTPTLNLESRAAES